MDTFSASIVFLDGSFYVVTDDGDHFGPFRTRSDARAYFADFVLEEVS